MVNVILGVLNFGKLQQVGDFEHLDRMCLPLFLAMLCSRPMVVFIATEFNASFISYPKYCSCWMKGQNAIEDLMFTGF
jgi:hypothetical protein